MKTILKLALALIIISTYSFADEMKGVGVADGGVDCAATKDGYRASASDKTPSPRSEETQIQSKDQEVGK
jgi:hypothetical protein